MDINNILDGSKKKSGKSFSEEFKQKKDVNVDDSNHQQIKDNNTEYPEIKNNNDIVSAPPSDNNDTSDDNDPIYKVIKIIGVSIIVLLLIVVVINSITTKTSPSNENVITNIPITQDESSRDEEVASTDIMLNKTEQNASNEESYADDDGSQGKSIESSASDFMANKSADEVVIAKYTDSNRHCIYIHKGGQFLSYELDNRTYHSFSEEFEELGAWGSVKAAKQKGDNIYLIVNNGATGVGNSDIVVKLNTYTNNCTEVANVKSAQFKNGKIKITDLVLIKEGDYEADNVYDYKDSYLEME